jgi:hypothetical protein
MIEDDATTLRGHLTEFRDKTLMRLVRCAERGTTEPGLLALVAHTQATLDALETVAREREA